MSLAEREWVPHAQIKGPLGNSEVEQLARDLSNAWHVEDGHHLLGKFQFDDFNAAQDFIDRVGALAEELNHHPDLCFGWGYAEVKIWTHSVDGITVNDLIFASRADGLTG